MEPAEVQREFLQAIFRGEQGVIRFAARSSKINDFYNALFAYPEQLGKAVDWIQQTVNAQHEVYFSPDLLVPEALADRKATKDYVRGSHVIPVDFDGNAPQDVSEYERRGLPVPSIIVQSSDEYHKRLQVRESRFHTTVCEPDQASGSVCGFRRIHLEHSLEIFRETVVSQNLCERRRFRAVEFAFELLKYDSLYFTFTRFR